MKRLLECIPKRLLRRIAIALVLIIGFLYYVARGDYTVAQWLWSTERTTFTPTENLAGEAHTATMLFPPTQTLGSTYSLPIRDISPTRLFVAADYPEHLFNAQRVAIEAFWYLKSRGVKRVVLIGASVSADVVKEFIRYNEAQGKNALEIIGVALADPAWSGDELTNKRAGIIRDWWWPGALANLFSRPFFGSGFNPPTPEPGVDEAVLARHHEGSKNFKLPSWGGQVRTAAAPSDAKPSEFAGIPVMILRSIHDTVVENAAIARWLEAYGVDGTRVIFVDSAHCDLPAYPKAWRVAFTEVFAKFFRR